MVSEADIFLSELKFAADYYEKLFNKGELDYIRYAKARDMYESARRMKEIMERGH